MKLRGLMCLFVRQFGCYIIDAHLNQSSAHSPGQSLGLFALIFPEQRQTDAATTNLSLGYSLHTENCTVLFRYRLDTSDHRVT